MGPAASAAVDAAVTFAIDGISEERGNEGRDENSDRVNDLAQARRARRVSGSIAFDAAKNEPELSRPRAAKAAWHSGFGRKVD